MTSKKPGRLDWIETIEVEQVDDDSEIEQQSRSTTRSRSTGGAGSTTPILRKQRTTSSNDHTDDGESSTDDLAGVAIVDRQISNSVRNNNSEQGTTSSEGRFANADTDSQQHRRRRLKLAGLCFLLLLLIIAVVVGGVCGAGKCPRGRSNEISSAQVELHPELYNDICERSVGPLTIGKVPAIGALKTVTSVSSIPTCSGNDSASLTSAVGRWFKVTGGDEVIRASTCNRGEKYVTTMDTTISIFQGDDCGSLTCVATNDDFCGTSSSVSLLAEKGVNYFIFVAKKDNDSPGNNSSSSSFLAASSSTTSSSASFDFVLTVDHEDNGLCVDPIGPLVVADGDVVAGSLRASDLQPLALTCDSNTAQNGVVWYTVKGTGRWIKASTCHNITEFEARLDVTSGSCTDSTCVAVRDSDCVGNGYQVVWSSRLDEIYHLAVFKDSATTGSAFGLSIESFSLATNDQCNSPASIANGAMITGSTSNATIDTEILSCPTSEIERPQPGVWYRVKGTGKTMLASTCNNLTDFATEISVYLANGSCDSTLTCVTTARKQFCKDFKAAVYWESQEGEEYLVHVSGSDYSIVPNVGQFGLTVADFVAEENDVCTNAIAMDLTNVPRVSGSTLSATPDVSCSASTSTTTPGVWYSITGTGAQLRASTCNQATTFDTQLSIFVGDCKTNNTCVISDDNSCGLQSAVAWSTEVGSTYYILVHGSGTSSVGDFVLTVEDYDPKQPNDFCTEAIPVELDGSVSVGSTVQATYDNIGGCNDVANTGPGVWYKTIGTGRRITASLCHNETTFNTAISVLAGNCTSQTCVAANDESIVNGCSKVSWLSSLDETYSILVHGYEDQVGNFGLSLTEEESLVENDFCVDATPVSLSENILTVSTVNATDDELAPCMEVEQTGFGVWYSVVGTGERIIASTCTKTPSDFDTKISVFSGANCGNLSCVVADDNGCGIQSRAVWRSQENVMYFILVHGPVGGEFGLVINRFVPALANDFCSAAQGPIIPNGQVAIGSTFDSSFDNAGYCGADNTSPGVWFFVLGTGERLTADTCDNRTNFDTKLSIFTGVNCANITCVTGNDDGCGLQSSITWQSEIGRFYYILLHGWGTNSFGNYALTVSGSQFPFD